VWDCAKVGLAIVGEEETVEPPAGKRTCPECGSDKVHFIGQPTREAAGQVEAAADIFMCEVCGAQFPDPGMTP